MMPALVIARLTVREASRKKLLLALLAVTTLVIGLSAWGFFRLAHINVPGATAGIPGRGRPTGRSIGAAELKAIVSQLLILVMFVFSFVLALAAVFMTAPSVAGDMESGVSLAILTRPISRLEYLLGKWLGLGLLASAYVAGASALEFLAVWVTTGYRPPHPFGFVFYLIAETIIILTLSLFISTRLPAVAGGVIALGGFMVAWMGGIAVSIGQAFNNHAVSAAGTVLRLILPTDGLWKGAVYSLEPAVLISAARGAGNTGMASNPFFSVVGPAGVYLAWSAGWLVVVLGLAAWSFSRKEI